MKRMMLVLGVMALAACGAQVDPEDVPRAEQGPEGPLVLDVSGGSTPSVYGLIGERQRLGLTGEQVTRLDSIAIVLAAANDSLRRSVREAWDGDRPRRGAERWDRTRPALVQIARNNRAAGVLVQNTLTEEQRRIACEIQEEVRARRPEPVRLAPRGSRRIGGRRSNPAADSAAMRPPADGWPWCPAPEPPARRR
ncbi:MAG: hypothetical protein KY467_00420 [Gemmatimonadetes bacterium]|nr:hypothetical protein [Gemmatimonadota bacterium]